MLTAKPMSPPVYPVRSDLRLPDRAGVVVRQVVRAPSGITVGPLQPGATVTVTGTDDLLLAAVLSATEAIPEVRGLAACHRLFPFEKAP